MKGADAPLLQGLWPLSQPNTDVGIFIMLPRGSLPSAKPTWPPCLGCHSVTCEPTSACRGSDFAGTNGSLSELSTSAGTRIDVELAGGDVAQFVVTQVRTYPNAEFPAHRVYARPGARRLNLVTCGGGYDRDRGGYQGNVVVYSRWVRTTRS